MLRRRRAGSAHPFTVATTGQEEFTLDTASELAAEEGGTRIEGRSPWALAARRLRRNHVALVFLGIFLLVLVACLLAPVYAGHVSHLAKNDTNPGGVITVNGQQVNVISQGHTTIGKDGTVHVFPGGVPIGPQWGAAGGSYVLGADDLGRDTATRLLYGGRNSLFIGGFSALICTFFSVVFALLAGYFRGVPDWIISRFFDLIWAFPVVLLGIALGTALSINGFNHWFIHVSGQSLWIPTAVISFVFIPYIGRPLRGQVLALREREFIEAATSQGAGPLRIMFTELLPNIASSVLVLFTLIVANTILTEAALSFLGAGVQPPNPSWGTMIADGQNKLANDPWLSLFPGIMLAITVLSLNIFGDGLRDALDPRAKVRIEH
ncbi:MAG TPA: ABC transporter permease [Gaiellaceae bacterium]|nr:ABC transporter permease [Gaiellaceae bacterium]